MSKLLELAERVEKAEGTDRELDAEIAQALGHKIKPTIANYTMEMDYAIEWQKPHPFAGMKEPCPRWTASLDAALTLVSPDDSWTLSRLGDGIFWCSVCFPDDEADNFTGTGKTPALAMVPAALRARAAMETTR